MSVPELSLRALTSLFIHLSPLHLLANLLVLAGMGPSVEGAVGTFRFFSVYLLAGIAGAGSHALMTSLLQTGVSEPLVGASASIAGLIGYAWLRFHRYRVPILPKVFIPVWLLAGLWAFAQLGGGLLEAQRGSPIAYWAHLGGFIAGFLLALLFKAGAHALWEAWQERLAEARKQGPSALLKTAEGCLREFPKALPALVAQVESLLQMGDTERARSANFKLIEIDPTYQNGFGIKTLIEQNWAGFLPAPQRLKLADQIRPSLPATAEQLLLTILAEPPSPLTPRALFMLAEMTKENDQTGASLYAQQLIREFPLTPEADLLRQKYPQLLSP